MPGPSRSPPAATLLPLPPRDPAGWIAYVDLDAYYVSCERRDRPELADRPVIVGPPPGAGPTRGVVLSASYDVRALGVHSAMPVAEAARRAPEAVWIPPDFPKYERVAEAVRACLRRFSPHVEPLSIDEAAVDLGAISADRARAVAAEIQAALRSELGLPASIGVATSRVVAKIASDRAKPGGLRVVPPEEVAAFLAPLPVRAIPGVGPKTEARLTAGGWLTVGQLASAPEGALARAVGPSFARELRALARGHPVATPHSSGGPSSRSADRTFPTDVDDPAELFRTVDRLATELGEALDRSGWRYGAVGVAFRWADFSRASRLRTLPAVAEGPHALCREAGRLARDLWEHGRAPGPPAVRTVSVRVERLHRRAQRQVSLADFAPAGPSVK